MTLDIFKRYRFGKPYRGKQKSDVLYLHGLVDIPQTNLASLNADGLAWDFNVWGTYGFTT